MVGGVLSLFSGFSFIIVFEVMYWIGVIVKDIVFPSNENVPQHTKKSVKVVNGKKIGPSNHEASEDVEKANNIQSDEYNHKLFLLETRIKALETNKFVNRRSKSPYLHAGY